MTDERHQREKKPHDIRHPADEPGVKDSTEPLGIQPGDRVAELEAELAARARRRKDAKERWLRERADVENLKKRTARERADAVRFGTENLVRDLLPVVDNLERAVQAAQGGGDGSSLVEGVSLVLKALHDVLGRHGVTRVEAEGTRFDPATHEAVAHVESAEHRAQRRHRGAPAGYRLHDRLLRPAMVTRVEGASGSNLANAEGGD